MATFGQIEYVIFGVVVTIAVYVGRMSLVKAVLRKGFSKLDKSVTKSMIPRGLAAAVLATYPITMGLPNAELYPQMIFFIILSSVIITTIGLGKSKKIPPPDSVQGGFVKPADDLTENQEINEEFDLLDKTLDGGFVKPADDSKN
jgi:cell volume regulation protein A